jgi:peptide deformylase
VKFPVSIQLVKPEEIPVAKDVPLDDPMEIYKVCKQMEIICRHERGAGLSAVQIGIPWKMFVLCGQNRKNPFVQPGKFGCFVNCEYNGVVEDGVVASAEGCLSIRSSDGQLRFFRVERYETIILNGLFFEDLKFKNISAKIKLDEDGAIYQHEIDHNSNLLISEKGVEVFLY